MRVFAISDIHVDYTENLYWLNNLSRIDYQDDILLLGGDVSDTVPLFESVMKSLRSRFKEVFFVPGNHDLWVHRNHVKDSLEKFGLLKTLTQDCGIRMESLCIDSIFIIPLFGWYDFSFGQPSRELYESWMDFIVCKWPEHWREEQITDHFISLNELQLPIQNKENLTRIISFSHFLPRIDLLPFYIPENIRSFDPVMGTSLLERQIRSLNSNIHVYGHSHVNVTVKKENTLYINNAFGYPYEVEITSKQLECIFES